MSTSRRVRAAAIAAWLLLGSGAGAVQPTALRVPQDYPTINNDGRGSEFAVVIEKDFGGGDGNSVGTTLRGNLGVNDINGSAGSVRNRSIHTLVEFP